MWQKKIKMRGKRMNCLKIKDESTRKKKRRRKRWR